MGTPTTGKTERAAGWRLAVCGIRIECGMLRFAAIVIAALPHSKA